jgi:Tfp pilus assembly protein PilF
MASSTEAFLKALEEGADQADLDAILLKVRDEEGAASLVAALKARLDHENEKGAATHEINLTQIALAQASEELAQTDPSEAGMRAAIDACRIWRDVLNDSDGAMRAGALCLRVCQSNNEMLAQAIEACGGNSPAEHLLRKRLKDEAVREDPQRGADLHRALQRILEQGGNSEGAFFESLKVARMEPNHADHVDEAFRLAVATERFEEIAPVFEDLAADTAVSDKIRSTLYNKLGYVYERGLDKPDEALTAYMRSLDINPSGKGARRHADRLTEELQIPGLPPRESPPPPPPDDADSSAEDLSLDDDAIVDEALEETASGEGVTSAEVPDSQEGDSRSSEGTAAPDDHEESDGESAKAVGGEEDPALAEGENEDEDEDEPAEANSDHSAEVIAIPGSAESLPLPEPDDLDKALDDKVRKADAKSSAQGKSEEDAPGDGGLPDADADADADAVSLLRKEALVVMESRNDGRCIELARDLRKKAPGDPLPGKLAVRAAAIQADQGAIDDPVRELVSGELAVASEATYDALLDFSKSQKSEQRIAFADFWIEMARHLTANPSRMEALTGHLLATEEWGGLAFSLLDEAYTAAQDTEGRDRIRKKAVHGTRDPAERLSLLEERLLLFADSDDTERLLDIHQELAIHAPADRSDLRNAAITFFKSEADTNHQARFLGRLAKNLDGDDAIFVLRELVALRRELNDELGTEAAARRLLELRPGDRQALEILSEVVGQSPGRSRELAEINEIRLTVAQSKKEVTDWLNLAKEQVILLEELGRVDEAVRLVRERVLAHPDRQELMDLAVDLLHRTHRLPELLSLLQDVAAKRNSAEDKVPLLLAAAQLARDDLGKVHQARSFVDQAIELAPDDEEVRAAHAEVAVALDDVDAALTSLEHLCAQTKDKVRQAALHFRIGQLLEERMLRPDDAMKRYQAAVAADPTHREALDSIRVLGRRISNRGAEVQALQGLIELAESKEEKAALWTDVARIEREERVDVSAAEEALREALAADPSQVGALSDLLTLMAARVAPDEAEIGLFSTPTPEFLEELQSFLLPHLRRMKAEDRENLPFDIRRLHALCELHQGHYGVARDAFEQLLMQSPDDLGVLRGYSTLLGSLDHLEDKEVRRRLDLMETLLRHHEDELPHGERARLFGEVGAMRLEQGDDRDARIALKKALSVSADAKLRLSQAAARAAVEVFKPRASEEPEPRLLMSALVAAAEHVLGAERAELLLDAALVAQDDLADPAMARRLLDDARSADADNPLIREALLDLDLADGDPEAILESTAAMVEKEKHPKRLAGHLIRYAKLLRRVKKDDTAALNELKKAIQLDGARADALKLVESILLSSSRAEDLSSFLRSELMRRRHADPAERAALYEMLAKVLRYELRDLSGAAEALEALASLDPDATKPREDAARVYSELGNAERAASSWRAVLNTDPLRPEAWRALFHLLADDKQGDASFLVAMAMSTLGLGTGEMKTAVRRAMPPFPRWPRSLPPPSTLRFALAHPLERNPIRAVFETIGLRAHPMFARPIRDFDLGRRERLAERSVPSSVSVAVKTVTKMLGLHRAPHLYRRKGPVEGKSLAFTLVPAEEPGLLIDEPVLDGGMTPARAFVLGRAMAWLMPHALLGATLSPGELKGILDALLLRFAPSAKVEGDRAELKRLSRQLEGQLVTGLSSGQRHELEKALRQTVTQYANTRGRLSVMDWLAGVGFTADRLGYLLAGDLGASARELRSLAGQEERVGARLALKELVVYSIGDDHLKLRRDLHLNAGADDARSIMQLARR